MTPFKRIALPLFTVAALSLGGMAVAQTLATVNGKAITQQDVDEFLEENPAGRDADLNAILDELITREMVLQDAKRKNLAERENVKAAIEGARKNVLLAAALEEAVAKPAVTESELRKIYDEEIAKLDLREFKARHILVDDKQRAEQIITELDMGGSFASLAEQHSKDGSAQRGGDLGWFNPQQMVPEFSRAVMQLEKGRYTKTPVQSQFGWHVIQLDDQRTGTPPNFSDVRPQLQQMVERQRLNEYLQSLRAKTEISVR